MTTQVDESRHSLVHPGIVLGLLIPLLLAAPAPLRAEPSGNLLRNAEFQDDWITSLPETKNHHWCYSSEFYNRRDFNPDAWLCRGTWDWLDADAPAGRRRLVLHGPSAELVQRVNWVAVHDDRRFEGFPDAGGFPAMSPQRSDRPLRVVRDLTLRVLVHGDKVPEGAGTLELAFCPPGTIAVADPLGTEVPPTASASAKLPSGTYQGRWVALTLKADDWLKAAQSAKDKPEDARRGPVLPGVVRVALRYKAPAGSVTIERAELTEAGTGAPNLLPGGGFEDLRQGRYLTGWSAPVKYRYFPPRQYYIFNTWHNGESENRGPVTVDTLVAREGAQSLKMIVAPGDEKAVASDLLTLNQAEPRLIEVRARVKTDRLCTLQIDAVDNKGRRLDGFNFIHKAPVSIGTDDWREVRQVFRPREPVKALRLLLCARGVNGYTLDDTGTQPQSNVVGTIWWDDIRLFEPESTADELAARGVKPATAKTGEPGPRLDRLDLGERLLGANRLTATLVNPGAERSFIVRWEFTAPSGKTTRAETPPIKVAARASVPVEIPYELAEGCPTAYTEFRGTLSLHEAGDEPLGSSELWFGAWTTPIDLELGALYLRPEQQQFVRMNLGVSSATLATLARLPIELVRRGTGQVLKGWEIRDVPAFVASMREKIPVELRDDFLNLVLARLDVSFLPVQPFDNPERNWYLRVRALDRAGHEVCRAESPPFCRLAHEPAQPPIRSVVIRDGLLRLDDRPWIPWGAIYGHVPVYAGPEGNPSVAFRDLHNLPGWNLYDRFTSETYNRRDNDLNCLRYVAGSATPRDVLEKRWKEDNLYAASVFVVPQPAFSVDDLEKQAGGRAKLDASLAFFREAPMVASLAPGIEEAFGLFQGAGAAKLEGLSQVVAQLHKQAGKPVMVGHGGYWNRFEFEKVPSFDIYDPETEPLFPADLHTDLRPLIEGKNKTIWLRPQMYEDVPYERWRFHAYVELMRGCRGWQVAHGPGDASLFRGLHGEIEHLRPVLASTDAGPSVEVAPWIEHWSRRLGGKLTLIAATTRGIPFGNWSPYAEKPTEAGGVSRRTIAAGAAPEALGGTLAEPFGVHGIQSLPDARRWPSGTVLRQWVWLHPKARPENLVVLARTDGRWTRAAAWGRTDSLAFRDNPTLAYWFLKQFYRQADGFLGWDEKLVPTALDLVLDRPRTASTLPETGRWTRLEIPLDSIGATDKLVDGVGFLHRGGRVYWGRTSLVSPDGRESIVWGDGIALPSDQLAKVRFRVPGLKAGKPVRVLFEDRTLTAEDGSFTDDFRGQDLYQRYGGEHSGYGNAPVALHAYELDLN